MKRVTLFVLALLYTLAAGADTKISALPAGTTIAGTEAMPMVQSAATVKTTPADLSTYVTTQLQTQGTYTASYTTGWVTNPTTQLFTWTKIGKVVILSVTGTATGTSNSAGVFTAVGDMPVNLRPNVRVLLGPSSAVGADVGVAKFLCIDIAVNGQLQWNVWSATTGCGTAFTASGTKTVTGGGWFLTYTTP
jgi:hypothetical protein